MSSLSHGCDEGRGAGWALGVAQERFLSRFTLASGLLTIAFGLWLGTIFPIDTELTRDFRTLILAFEFAHTPKTWGF